MKIRKKNANAMFMSIEINFTYKFPFFNLSLVSSNKLHKIIDI